MSRALSSPPCSLNVLALDFSEVQTTGAERRTINAEKKKDKKANVATNDDSHTSEITSVHTGAIGSLTHEMAHINPQTLESAVSKWISSTCQSADIAIPVLFVALHACGTLTPDILRCFLQNSNSNGGTENDPASSWYASGLVVVGCCYNLMSPDTGTFGSLDHKLLVIIHIFIPFMKDFPLSSIVASEKAHRSPFLHFSYNHRSLAAQIPHQWSLSPSSRKSAELAIRKVVYRALIGTLVSPNNISPNANIDHRALKIGRLPDTAYSSLQKFISEAERKTGVNVSPFVDDDGDLPPQYFDLIARLEVLHALRSRIGPVVESLIIVDRYLYLVENLPGRKITVMNLFDQEEGSGRNMAIAVYP